MDVCGLAIVVISCFNDYVRTFLFGRFAFMFESFGGVWLMAMAAVGPAIMLYFAARKLALRHLRD
jgi:hypothetical protein